MTITPAPGWDSARASLPPCWQAAIGDEFDTPHMRQLAVFLHGERTAGRRVFPPDALVFDALRRTPLNQVRAVIVGQDPYHRPGQAMGLAFSVPPGVRVPPSLRNIHRELADDVGVAPPGHGCLLAWAGRGVLLLNTALTVEEGRAGIHARAGWHRFTGRVLAAVDARAAPVAFLLWGGHAGRRAAALDGSRHLLHLSEHPSPLAAYRGFFGSRPFSRANAFLQARGVEPIDWTLPPA